MNIFQQTKPVCRYLLMIGMVSALSACVGGTGGGGSSGGGGSQQVNFNANQVFDNTANDVITQDYINLNSAADNLLTAVQALDDGDPTEADMDAAQQAWKDARVPWESSEGFLFGPVDSLGIDPAIDSWPLNTPDLNAFLASNPNATQQDVENAGDDVRGFHAIEFLLFGDGVVDNEKTAVELDAQSGAINYLVALVQAFKARTDALENSWTTDFNGKGPYADLVANPGSGNPAFGSGGAVMQQLIGAMSGIVAEVGQAKIADAFGTNASNADTSQVESQYSYNSLTDFSNNIQSVLNVYTGVLGFDPLNDTLSDTDNGVFAFVLAHDSNLAMRVFDEIRAAQKAIALIKGDGDDTSTEIGPGDQPFRTQITDPTGRMLIGNAVAALDTLRDTLDNNVAPLVGKTNFQ